MDNLHSVYTDQWDWEKIITRETRTVDYLKKVVQGIVGAICDTLDFLKCRYPQIDVELTRTVQFITSQELEDLYPNLSSKERENAYVKEHKTVFIMQIGDKLKSGKPHDLRAPDYDDWSLNGDILFWHKPLGMAMEISSMGIRVDEKSLDSQLTKTNTNERRELPFHKALLAGELPLTIGGGIGQSRLSMLLLGKAHIGEVQVSLWDEKTKKVCKENGIVLL
jgi:aspartate--ammonia ligase